MFCEQFEGTISLEFDPLPGHVGEEEAEVNMKHFAAPVEEDVPIVPVLGLQDVHHQRISRQTLHEDQFRLG